ncbi:MAG: glycosyltransferase, partial [Anaerolineae bacterium]|nr:glycosyltransferase [Anaerolineae bacterium]
MKILLLTPDLPYPSESGAALRNMGIIRGLRAAGHEVTLLSFRASPEAPSSSPLAELCHRLHTAPLPNRTRRKRLITLLTTSRADLESRLASDAYERALRQELQTERFDIVQFSGIELGGYLEAILAAKGSAKVVYDALNAEADLQRVIARVDAGRVKGMPAAVYSAAQARRLSRFEERVCTGVDAVIAVSGEDRDLLGRYGGAPITVMSNGIAVAEYRPPADNTRSKRHIVFSGKMDYRPNVDAAEWLCKAIMPRVWEGEPAACLSIVGRNPHPRLGVLAEDPRIKLTGWVESVLPYLHEAALFVVPLRMGSGTRLK